MSFYVVTAFTPDYRSLAERLCGSLNRYCFLVSTNEYQGVDGPLSWDANCLHKAGAAFASVLPPSYTDQTVWFLDADMVCKKNPRPLFDSFEKSDKDIAAHRYPGWETRRECMKAESCIIGVKPTPRALACIAFWVAACQRAKPDSERLAEQAWFYRSLEFIGLDRVFWLPEEANVRPEQRFGTPVFFHDPASRKMRKESP